MQLPSAPEGARGGNLRSRVPSVNQRVVQVEDERKVDHLIRPLPPITGRLHSESTTLGGLCVQLVFLQKYVLSDSFVRCCSSRLTYSESSTATYTGIGGTALSFVDLPTIAGDIEISVEQDGDFDGTSQNAGCFMCRWETLPPSRSTIVSVLEQRPIRPPVHQERAEYGL